MKISSKASVQKADIKKNREGWKEEENTSEGQSKLREHSEECFPFYADASATKQIH